MVGESKMKGKRERKRKKEKMNVPSRAAGSSVSVLYLQPT